MESRGRTALLLVVGGLFFCFFVVDVSAQCMIEWGVSGSQWGSFSQIQNSLVVIGSVVALFFMLLEGITWTIAESPEDREDAKKGIIYIVIGLIILTSTYSFVYYLLC